MKIEMEGGHGGASGRYVQWKERAWDYAFVADSLGATELLPGAGVKSAPLPPIGCSVTALLGPHKGRCGAVDGLVWTVRGALRRRR